MPTIPAHILSAKARITSGADYTARTASFTVLPSPTEHSGGAQPSARVDDIGTQSADRGVNANDVLVRIILNKTGEHEQEAILCTIKLYTKHSISSFIPTTQPSFDGFLIDGYKPIHAQRGGALQRSEELYDRHT